MTSAWCRCAKRRTGSWPGSPGVGGLSQREAQVAAYVAQGLTNRQIAAAEHISERTVETHVRHIFAKLGFATRAQLAAWHAIGGERVRTSGQ